MTSPRFPRKGSELLSDITSLQVEREVYIEDFLHQRSVVMLAADPGTGKSLISTQMCMALTSAEPLFGELSVTRKHNVNNLH